MTSVWGENWPFAIDEDTGIIMVIGDLRRVKHKRYNLTVKVTDQGSPRLSSYLLQRFRIIG